jgi:phosphopantothenoylcysteine decarboxylase/phosphopantothenate--cysteine ligase
MARILLGVSGGIAGYKAVEFVRLAVEAGHSVRVVMTGSARRFIGAETFEGILGAPVLVSEFESDPMRGTFPGDQLPEHQPIGHLAIVESADLYLIAPASANTIAKLAAGIADSMVTTTFLACEAPRLVSPAMNDRMYLDPATQENLERLRQRGVGVIEPDTGRLASKGEYGTGRLPDPARLLATVEQALSAGTAVPEAPTAGDLAGLRILVTAGGTREPLDEVRYIGNRSSGKMGRALASEAVRRGAEVTLIEANPTGPPGPGLRRIDVETTAELAEACKAEFRACDVLLMAAAPADFRSAAPLAGEKISRKAGSLSVALEPTEDILAGLAGMSGPSQTVIGFAAEVADQQVERAREKLLRKGVDMIVLNDVSDPDIGFDSDRNEVTLVTHDDVVALDRAPKEVVAAGIIDQALGLRDSASQ